MFATSTLFTDQERQLLGWLYPLSVKFNWIPYSVSNKWHWYYSYEYGNCFQFNSGLNWTNSPISSEKSTAEGEAYGLKILGFVPNQNKYLTSPSSGLKVFIHNHSFGPSFSNGINVQTGTEINIAVKRTFTQNEPKPYTECDSLVSFSSDLYNFIINSGKTYRQEDCFRLCRQNLIIKNCGCYWTKFGSLHASTLPCLNYTALLCNFNTYLAMCWHYNKAELSIILMF